MRLENREMMTQCQLARYQLEGRIFGREDIYLYLYGPICQEIIPIQTL